MILSKSEVADRVTYTTADWTLIVFKDTGYHVEFTQPNGPAWQDVVASVEEGNTVQ